MVQRLHDAASLRANTIIDNGRTVPEVDRAKSAGYADAYAFCLHILRDIRDGYID